MSDSKRRRDSSLYKDVASRKAPATNPAGPQDTPANKSGFRFVLESSDPEVVPVEHQAVIAELQASLATIRQNRQKLENDLQTNNKANKLQIAQIKGRLAELNRKQAEIEGLLSARKVATGSDEEPTQE